ncbi:MAG: fused MFS/spermidine synthase [Gammaproteobacteria bacterium]|nr:fused MFS/spermidine synthase [Gammaproteobacteria bacterium]
MIPARMLVPLYAAALFLGSMLLFGVQPMVTRMLLPQLGGSPAVWNTAQVFFQAALLAGYLYAHAVMRLRDGRLRLAIHGALLFGAMLFLPVAIDPEWAPPVAASPIPSLLAVLALSIGLPFFAVASTAPLLQGWFSHTTHAQASDPYFLYSASNLGGLAALIGYPFLFEPAFGLEHQGLVWGIGFVALAMLVLTAGALLPGFRPAAANAGAVVPAAPDRGPTVTWPLRIRWLLLAFAPSSLMLGVTLHITTDIAASPVLWVLPLSLYLLTFVISFARRPVLRHAWMLALQPVLVGLLLVFFDSGRILSGFALHLGAFFVTAMVCHGELARTRPQVGRLTEFYLWLSLGGVLGGAFSGVVAPLAFDSVIEYPLALVLACALRPGAVAGPRSRRVMDFTLPLLLGLGYLAVVQRLVGVDGPALALVQGLSATVVCVSLFLFRRRSVRFAAAVAFLAGVSQAHVGPSEIIAQERSFFGVHRVIVDASGLYHVLTNGRTVHGAEFMEAPLHREPLTYYTRAGPAGQVFSALRASKPDARIGAVGLGSGAITCYLTPGQRITYFEIDSEVVALATNPKYFLYLPECGANAEVILGDGRRNLERSGDGSFDLLVLDAFSSDAVPAHLLTREAVQLYARKLKPGGVLLMHLSNRRLDLVPVAGAVIRAAGLTARVQRHEHENPALERAYHWSSTWVIAARKEADLAVYDAGGHWRRLQGNEQVRPWTDDYSNVAGAVKWDRLW